MKEIIKALAQFQDECPAIKKDSSAGTGNFSYKYGSLPHILEAIKPHLKTAGLTYAQPISILEGQRCIVTQLYHVESGEKIESVIDMPDIELKGMNQYQSMGSGITYLRRYALMSILGIVAEEDDNDAAGEEVKKTPEQKKDDTKLWLNPEIYNKPNLKWAEAVKYLAGDGKIADIKAKYKISKANEERLINESLAASDVPEPDNELPS